MDRLYSENQIEVPKAFPAILKAYAKEVIRYNPKDIIAFSKDYFTSIANEALDKFLEDETKKKESDDKKDKR